MRFPQTPLFLSLLLCTLLTTALFAQDHSAITGEWFTADKKAKIEMYVCNEDEVCGKVVWLEEPNNEEGEPKKDINNPVESKQENPVLGMDLLKGFEKTDEDTWENGTIYDPNKGKTYKCKLTLEGKDQLNVRGFIGFSLLGRTEEWTRAE